MPVSREPLQITFCPFRENRLSVTVRVTDPSQAPTCRLAFLKEPRKDRLGNVRTICNLSIDLSKEVRPDQWVISPYLMDTHCQWAGSENLKKASSKGAFSWRGTKCITSLQNSPYFTADSLLSTRDSICASRADLERKKKTMAVVEVCLYTDF